jgi:hypothetical protein
MTDARSLTRSERPSTSSGRKSISGRGGTPTRLTKEGGPPWSRDSNSPPGFLVASSAETERWRLERLRCTGPQLDSPVTRRKSFFRLAVSSSRPRTSRKTRLLVTGVRSGDLIDCPNCAGHPLRVREDAGAGRRRSRHHPPRACQGRGQGFVLRSDRPADVRVRDVRRRGSVGRKPEAGPRVE